ncbi:hypothetical protein BH23ACT10_BH23ACT10_34170 [soil metagenome]
MKRSAMVLVALWSLLLIGGPAAAQSDTTTVTLVHGFRGLLADVYLDGDRILEGFKPARSTDPTELPAGEHKVEVREADAAADSKPVVQADLDLPAGANLSAVVHPDADGNPTVSVFDNDYSPPGNDKARAVVRHTAVAPAIKVTVGKSTVADALKAGEEGDGTVDPGADEVTTVDATSSKRLLPPARIKADPDVVVALYLIGSNDDDSLGWLSQRLDTTSGTTPLGVPTGDSGLVATTSVPWWAWAAGALALLTALHVARLARAEARVRR